MAQPTPKPIMKPLITPKVLPTPIENEPKIEEPKKDKEEDWFIGGKEERGLKAKIPKLDFSQEIEQIVKLLENSSKGNQDSTDNSYEEGLRRLKELPKIFKAIRREF